MEEMFRVPVVIYRGGTSKAIFIKENDLPSEQDRRDSLICRLFGSPDKRQIDGLGGADPLTSKLAIIGPPSRPDADVDYTFGQVDILSESVLYVGVCGNISAAVGPYAIEEGFVRPTEPVTRVRIHNTNTGRIIEASVPAVENHVRVKGDFAIDGVPGTGAKIELNWADAVGAKTGTLLPTGNVQDELNVTGAGRISVSIVDVGNPGVFVKARDLGLKGTEHPDDVDHDTEFIEKCNAIAAEAGSTIGSFALLTYVAAPESYRNYETGNEVKPGDMDFLVRMIFMGKMHKAYAASQITCCGAAAMIPGTVVNECMSGAKDGGRVRMGHPSGIADLEVTTQMKGKEVIFPRLVVCRTARRLMEGHAFVRY